MEYRQGTVGRVFLVKFSHGEDLVQGLLDFARGQNLRAAWIQLLGALQRGRLVVGPEKAEVPPTPVWQEVQDAWEVLGVGNLLWEDDAPRLHFHGALGRGENTLTGCLRQQGEVYLVIEALIVELAGLTACRAPDAATGLSLLQLG
jgi:predicted DNA-binding protein with PD1-like motif